MPSSIDKYLGVHAAALTAALAAHRSARGESRERGYAGLSARATSTSRARSRGPAAEPVACSLDARPRAGHIGAATVDAAREPPELKYRMPLAPALDGNTVDAQLEQAAFAENSVRYQATLTFLNARVPRPDDGHHAASNTRGPYDVLIQDLRHRRLRHERAVGAPQHHRQQSRERRQRQRRSEPGLQGATSDVRGDPQPASARTQTATPPCA